MKHPLSSLLARASRKRAMSAGICLAMLLGGSAVMAQSSFTSLDSTPEGQISFAAATRGQPILAGSEVLVSGQGFEAGQQITLLHGDTPLQDRSLVAAADGSISASIIIPADAVIGTHPIVVVAQNPYHAAIAQLKVSPTIPLFGQEDYEVVHARASRGLYQSAYSTKHNTVFVASAVGRPPVSQSELVKLDADTLEILTRANPKEVEASASGQGPVSLYAVYGVGLDDTADTVWVTNTRQNTIAVYQQSDLSLIKQFAANSVQHPRDVLVDSIAGKAFVSATGMPEVVVVDTSTLEIAEVIEISSLQRRQSFSAASMSLDAEGHRLYVVSLSTSEVAIINTLTNEVEKVLAVPGARGTIGVSHDAETGRIFVAAQGTDNLVILDAETGSVLADTPIGAGALNVVFDPVQRRAYVSNRGAGSIAITDEDGMIIANLGPAPSANHVSLGKDGTIFAVDKSAGATGEENDSILRIRPRR